MKAASVSSNSAEGVVPETSRHRGVRVEMEQEAAGRGLSLPPQWLRDLARLLVEVEPPPCQGSTDLAGEDGGLGAVGEGASSVLPAGAHDAERGCSHCRTDGCPECWTIVGRRRRLRRGTEMDRWRGVRAGQEDCLSSPGVVTPPPGRPARPADSMPQASDVGSTAAGNARTERVRQGGRHLLQGGRGRATERAHCRMLPCFW